MKKYLSIFLIFCLFFCVSLPAFASSDTPVPPSLDTLGCDSYAIIDAYTSVRDETGKYSAQPSFVCLAYDSTFWQLFHIDDDDSLIVRFVSLSGNANSNPPYMSNVLKTIYDSTSNNNGWTLDECVMSNYTIDGNIVYSREFLYSYTGLDYYDSESATLAHNPILLSNLDIYNGTWSNSTGANITNDVFFSPIPPLIVETEKALTQFQNQTIQTILILLLCGVGCLALLISLVVLRKLFYRFLNK